MITEILIICVLIHVLNYCSPDIQYAEYVSMGHTTKNSYIP